MKWLPHSIRWRMHLWHGLLLSLVLVGFGVTSWKLEMASEMSRVDEELQPYAGIALGMFRRHGDGPPGRRPPPRDPFSVFPELGGHPPVDGDFDDLVQRLPPKDGFFRSWDRENRTIMERGDLAKFVEPPDNEDFTPLNPKGYTTNLNGRLVRQMEVFTPNGESAIVGRQIHAELTRMNSLKWRLIGLGSGVWLVALLVGGWLTGRALRPIQKVSASALRIADGHLSERINVEETESELGQMASVLNTSFERLEQSFEKQAQFTADAAHELRTPITVMLSQAQLTLARERDAAEYRDALAACERAAKRMQALTESLLQLSRLDAKAEPMHLGQADLAIVAKDTVDLLRPLAEAHQIELSVELRPAPCRGDAEMLGQVLTNLLSNALHHSADGTTIHIRAGTDGENAVASIRDEGPGIAAEHLPRLFDRFYRADESRNRNTGGAGLGLAICKAIMDAHHGSIEARSEVGKGSEFVIKLPNA